jgi:hypothetical protein
VTCNKMFILIYMSVAVFASQSWKEGGGGSSAVRKLYPTGGGGRGSSVAMFSYRTAAHPPTPPVR